MPQNVQSKPAEATAAIEAARGLVVNADDPAVLARAIDLAFEYRGDVTLNITGCDEPLVGYVFDRSAADDAAQSKLRVLPADGSDRVTVTYADVQRLEFSGRDTAEGKSFDTWMRKYVEKKLAGEEASIHGMTHESGDGNQGEADA